MLCFRRNKGYKVAPKKKKAQATTSTSISTSTNQTSPRTRNGTDTNPDIAIVTQRKNKVTAKKTRPSPDRYSNSRPSPFRKRNTEQGPPIQPPRQRSNVARTNDMSAQNSSFYGRVNSAITSGFEDDRSATAVENRTNKPQESSSSNAAQSQAYDTTPVPSTQSLFRYQRPSFLDDFDFTAESPHHIVIAPGFTSALSPRQAYHSTPASILNFADFDLENTDAKISDIRHDNISPHEKPIASAAVASSSSPSSASPHLDLSESPDTDTVTASAILFQILSLRNARTLLLYVWIACCHECKEKLEYNDIQRLADEQTIAKYERQALRAAVADEENFFWCTSDCGSGQIHDSGSTQPIVVCIKCNHRSCFRHGVNWHEDLSCDEYDRLQEDPEFRSYLELENERWEEAQAAQEAQEEADRDVARRLAAEENAETERQEAQDRRVREREREQERNRVYRREIQRNQETQREQERQRAQRQRQLEQERQQRQRELERERQRTQERRQLVQERQQRQRELERERQRQRNQERQRQLEQQRQRELERESQRNQERQRALREKASPRNAAEERRKIAARRREEEAKSNATLRATSKPCGGCGWAIEKSFGW
ncbi:RING finger Dorfin [Fusarium pseudoanthophilum]|uniref:RING finger Dorfin n=1 Tax=Fusarium pseudoanthophilum TaxID=48495 RepID=A0A8H5L0U5_9HYPO|nr:RING finger Dorfin [Fusarium pseudoanthophilum]